MKRFTMELEREADGRWIADIPELPGVMAYGATENEAIVKCQALALRVLADQLEHDGKRVDPFELSFVAA